MALVTSGDTDYTELMPRRFQMRGFFQCVITGDRVSHHKPHPEPYLTAADCLGVRAGDCVGFEDSGVGIDSLQNAGMYSVAVHADVYRRPELSEAAERFTSLAEITRPVVKRLFSIGTQTTEIDTGSEAGKTG